MPRCRCGRRGQHPPPGAPTCPLAADASLLGTPRPIDRHLCMQPCRWAPLELLLSFCPQAAAFVASHVLPLHISLQRIIWVRGSLPPQLKDTAWPCSLCRASVVGHLMNTTDANSLLAGGSEFQEHRRSMLSLSGLPSCQSHLPFPHAEMLSAALAMPCDEL